VLLLSVGVVAAAATSNPVLPAVGSLALGLVVLVFLLYRQLRPRTVRASPILPVALLVVGLAELNGYAQAHPLTGTQGGLLALSLIVFAIGLGAVRAWTVRLFVQGSRLMRQGTWITAGIWVVAVALHLAVDGTNGVGGASLLLYLGLTLGTQQLVVQWRARTTVRRMLGGVPQDVVQSDGGTPAPPE